MTANDLPDVGIPARLAGRLSMPEQHAYLRERLSRRGVLRGGGLMAAGAAGAAGLVLGSDAASRGGAGSPTPVLSPARVDGALVAPFGRHLAFGADPRSRMRISWQVPFAVRRPYVRIGTAPWDLGHRIEAEVRALRTPALTDRLPAVEQHHLHVALDGLRPGTTYYYGVGHDGFDPAAAERLGTVGSFTTAPAGPGRPFVFTAFGDQGVGYDALAADQLLLGQNPAFHLHAGDLCYAEETGHGTASGHYDARVWDQYLAQTEPVAARVPWMVTTGNHDMEAPYSPNGYGGQAARWSLPDDGPDPARSPGIYSFVYGNLGVIALDANDVSHEIPANRGHTDGAQTRWLAAALRRLRRDPVVRFVVVFFHHCAYSTSTHGSEGGVREAWVPLFDAYRVDLVINGHNHVYERTDPLRRGSPSRSLPVGGTTVPSRDGTVYVTAGGGGRELYGFAAPDAYEGSSGGPDSVRTFHWAADRTKVPTEVGWSRVRYTGYSFLAVSVTSGALDVTALATTGRRVDHFEVRR